MKKGMIILVVLMMTALALNVLGQGFTYVGAAKCQMCHKTETQGKQYPIWQASKHAASYAALSSPQAPPNSAEDPKCQKCHAPLFEKAPELKAEGVTCEVCHGPGSEYKKLSLMKNPAEAAKNGLILYANAEAIKAHCLTCHVNPHNKPFDFDAASEKIKHKKPGQ